jgi:arsenate reductase
MSNVLFVCVHNSGRSQMAEAFFNRMAAERGLPLRAASAGTMPGEKLNPAAETVMEEIGIPLSGHRPKLLTPELAAEADKIITMGCGVEVEACPVRIFISEDWGLDDPAEQPIERVREIRDQIRERVNRLLMELA